MRFSVWVMCAAMVLACGEGKLRFVDGDDGYSDWALDEVSPDKSHTPVEEMSDGDFSTSEGNSSKTSVATSYREWELIDSAKGAFTPEGSVLLADGGLGLVWGVEEGVSKFLITDGFKVKLIEHDERALHVHKSSESEVLMLTKERSFSIDVVKHWHGTSTELWVERLVPSDIETLELASYFDLGDRMMVDLGEAGFWSVKLKGYQWSQLSTSDTIHSLFSKRKETA